MANKEAEPNIIKRNMAPITCILVILGAKLVIGGSLSPKEFQQGVENRIEEVAENGGTVIPRTPPTL